MRKPWKHKKAAALALCVSLWMAGGSVAGARDTTVTDADNTGNGTWVYGNNNGTVLTDGTDPPSNNTIAVELTTRTLNTVYGAYFVNSDDIVSGNTVNIIKGTVTNIANGGQSDTGAVTDNHVNISGGIVSAPGAGGVVGGQSFSGAATKNTVTISGTANVKGDVYGAMSYTGNAGGSKEAKNTVTISGGTVGTAGGNTAIIGGGAGGTASYNEVAISGGIVYSDIWGGTGDTANNNTVEISGGTINSAYIRGGRGTTEASGNTVTISGNATINALDSAYIYGGAEAPVTKNNTVNILTAISVRGLYGGMGATTSSGNTLNLAAKGVKVGEEGVAGFQNYNFFLPTTMTTTDTMLTVNGTAYVDGAKVGVLAQGKLDSLKKDDKVTLLHANTLNGTVSQTTEIDVPESIATVDTYEFNVTSDANNIYATITKAPEEGGGEGGGGESGGGGEGGGGKKNDEAHQNTKSIVETKAATTTFVNAGADMLASQGFAQAANAVALEMAAGNNGAEGAPTASGFTPFAAFGGSGMRAESGSHVDTRGFGLNVGFAREIANSQGKLLFGPVVEYGGGNYDSYLDNGVHGEGGAHYFGVGIMARQVNHDGFYYEGSVRGGRVTSDYKSAFNGQTVDYDSSSNYWAAHLGVGKAAKIGGNNTLDAYLKYFYSHQGGDSVTMHASVTGDEEWRFDSVDSNRIRIGARLTHKVNEMNSFYGGLAYQYEFGGEATAHYNGGSTPSPSVKGSSGMLELGWQVKPGAGPLILDLGVTGWAGRQRGGSVQLGVTWTF